MMSTPTASGPALQGLTSSVHLRPIYGERQYVATDLAGHQWTFTQSVADVSPEEWGGTTATPW